MSTFARILCGLITCTVLGGCTSPPRGARHAGDPDPGIKIPAIRKAVEKRDARALPVLVNDLASDDPAVRFYAIEALQRFTDGDEKGYVYYASDEDRAPALDRWKAWLAEQMREGEKGN